MGGQVSLQVPRFRVPVLAASTSPAASTSRVRVRAALFATVLAALGALALGGVAHAIPTVQLEVTPTLVSSTSPSANFSATEGGQFSVRLDALGSCAGTVLVEGTYTAPAAISVPVPIGALAEGANTIRACVANATGTGSATAVVTKDTTPPASPTITQSPPTTTASANATIAFTHVEPGVSFFCSLDSAPAAGCTSPAALSGLNDGSHTFSVYAVDGAGNVGSATPAVASWLVDTSNPQTVLSQTPASHTNATSATFAFSSPIAGATFECSLDGGPPAGPTFTPCASPQTFDGLGDDTHVFSVRAINAAGTRDRTPAAWVWQVDTVAPTTTLVAAPSGVLAGRDAALEFATDEPGAGFQCKLNAAGFSTCMSPLVYIGLADGTYTVLVRAVDAAGNADASPLSVSFSIDLPPETTLVAGPVGAIATPDATFVFAASTPTDTFECGLDGAAFQVCSSPHDIVGLAPGEHSLDVRAVDAGGERDPTPARATWSLVTLAASPAAFAANVRKARVEPGDHRAALSWRRPKDRDYHHVEIVRVPGKGKKARSLVYKGNKIAFVDKGLKNGVEYTWIVYAADKKGNRSGGVKLKATNPVQVRLGRKASLAPQTPIVLSWNPRKRAQFYNVQLFRGQKKVLSSWPAREAVSLVGSWNWEGAKRKLVAGTYEWFVWPGFGKRADSNFGKLIGSGKLVVKDPNAKKTKKKPKKKKKTKKKTKKKK
ncbi:MAG: hypothetical protein ACR2OD_00300 [Gaiellaceae bacterium]